MPSTNAPDDLPSVETMDTIAIEAELKRKNSDQPERWFFYSLEEQRTHLDRIRKGVNIAVHGTEE